LELGGPARWFIETRDDATLVEAVAWARSENVPILVLGGGSNLVIDDAGFDGLVISMAMRGVRTRPAGDRIVATAAAGESWDAFTQHAVTQGWAGIECLSGIPGRVGATPIQNVGAYGQEVSETITAVRVFDPETGRSREVAAAECEFAYRDSAFKRAGHPLHRAIVTAVSFALRPGGAPKVAYAELQRAIGDAGTTLAKVRETVIGLRRAKSMVIDSSDENRRSAGSFFTNVLLSRDDADALYARSVAAGLAARAEDVPRFDGGANRVKIPSAWLIERAGFAKGQRFGAFGISSKHALALVHHGGGTTHELLSVANAIRARVHEVFGVTLVTEPVFLGSAVARTT
jgi:UDP-N-acetylmuramate dehydrogenase